MRRQPQLKKEDLGKLYKEFSRQKYNKYKHQYPRMREAELVTKIIKEWEALTPQERQSLYKTYSENQSLPEDGSESSDKKESPSSSKQKKKRITKNNVANQSIIVHSDETPDKKSKVQVFNRSSSSKKAVDQSQESDYDREGVKKDFQVSQSDQEIGRRPQGKKKRITKQVQLPRNKYLSFFRFYYEKLSKEHANWSANQISTIIKLLWKKKLSQQKKLKKIRATHPRERKRTSGRLAFRRFYNYTGIESAQRWKQLTRETKYYWKQKGLGLSLEGKDIQPNITFRSTRRGSRKGSQDEESVAERLSYLTKTMRGE